MKEAKKRIKELEQEIKSDTNNLQNTIQQINTLQNQAHGIELTITSKKGGLLELRKIEEQNIRK